MTYIISNTISEGKGWIARSFDFLSDGKKSKVLSTPNSIRGRSFSLNDDVYILTTDNELLNVLIPALVGCRVFSRNEWILKK